MSETPQSVLEKWLEAGSPTHLPRIREAIRAVLAQLEQARSDRDEAISQCVSIGRESKKLEAERDALRQRVEALEREVGPCLPECIPPGVHSLHCTRAYLARTQSAEAERDALRDGSDEDARALLHLNDLLTAAEAEVERLERARLRSADWLTFEKMEAESDALRSTVHDLSVQIEEGGKEERALREIMRRLVHGIDKWNAGVEPIIGRAVDYKWLALEEARAAIAPEVKP